MPRHSTCHRFSVLIAPVGGWVILYSFIAEGFLAQSQWLPTMLLQHGGEPYLCNVFPCLGHGE